MKRDILAAIAAAALSATPLWAQDDDLFGKLDKNADGVVTADEVEGDAKGLFERSLRRGDKDGDKKLTKEEFAASQKETDTPRQPLGQGGAPGRGGGQINLREFFARLDENKDGKISKDEARGPLGEGFDRFDANKDGFIVEDEMPRPGAPGPGGRPDPRQIGAMFDGFDANKDGKLTKDEISEDRRERFAQYLKRLGADSIDKEQFARFVAMVQLGEAGRPGEPGRPGQPGPGGPPGGGRPPLFVALDADNDGELSSGEIEASTKSLLKLDKNSDGKLTREELFPGSPDGPPRDRPGEGRPGEGRPGPGRGNPEEFQARLKEADKNGDGKLSKDEAPPMLKERFDRIDANSDGELDATELRQMFQRQREGADRRPEGRRPEGDRPEGGRPDAPRRE